MTIGLLNTCVVDFLFHKYGDINASKALDQAGLPRDVTCNSTCPYADATILGLMNDAATICGVTADDLHRDFGRFFITWIQGVGYSNILHSLGGNFVDFMSSLNNMHLFMSIGIPEFQAPEFLVDKVTPTSLILHYFSQREGLWTWVEGIVDEAATQLFGMQIRMEKLKGRDLGDCDHEIYRVTFPAVGRPSRLLDQDHFRQQAADSLLGLTPDAFFHLFPFHFVLDLDLRVLQAGSILRELVPELACAGTKISEVIQILHPRMPWVVDRILMFQDRGTLVLSTESGLELKGGLYKVRQSKCDAHGVPQDVDDVILFLGSPRFADLVTMRGHGLHLSDIPSHDSMSDFLLMAEQKHMEASLKEEFERKAFELAEATARLDKECREAAGEKERLKEHLEKALIIHDEGVGRSALTLDTPADMAIKLLDALILGEKVDVSHMMKVRSALLRAGSNMWQPLDFKVGGGGGLGTVMEGNDDDEINRALEQLLVSRKGSEAYSLMEDDFMSRSEDPAPMGGDEDEAVYQQDAELRISPELLSCAEFSAPLLRKRRQSLPDEPPSPNRPVMAGLASPLNKIGSSSAGSDTFGGNSLQPSGTGEGSALLPMHGHPSMLDRLPSPNPPTVAGLSRPFNKAGSTSSGTDRSSNSSLQPSRNGGGSAPHSVYHGRTILDAPPSSNSPIAAGLSNTLIWAGSGSAKSPPAAMSSPNRLIVRTLLPIGGRSSLKEMNPEGTEEGVEVEAGPSNAGLDAGCNPLYAREPAVLAAFSNRTYPSPIVRPDVLLKVFKQPSDRLATILKDVEEWQFDSFALEDATQGKPLSCLAFHLMKKMDMVKRFRMDEKKLAKCLMRIELGYSAVNPYHSRIHAADVLRSLHVLLTRGGVLSALVASVREDAKVDPLHFLGLEGIQADDKNTLSKLLVCYLAAIVLDYEHRGVNNDFLVKTTDPLALRYNDVSPMENHHVAAAFTLMREDEYSFIPVSMKRFKEVLRKNVIELVLATDMKQHFSITSIFSAKVMPLHGNEQPESLLRRPVSRHSSREHAMSRAASGPSRSLSGSTAAAEATVPAWDIDAHMLISKVVLKCADLGHLTSSTEVHKQWVLRLEEEMFRQGDQERALGEPVSPLMDRHKGGVTKSQTGFFNIVVTPLFKAFVTVFPAATETLNNLMANYRYWQETESAGGSSPHPDAGGGLAY